MKTLFNLALAVIAVVLCGAVVLPANKPVTPYNPEQVKGKVRVVLLRVDRTTVFSDEGFKGAKTQGIHAIPGLSVVYAIELLGDEPVKHWNSIQNGKLISVNSKPLTTPENLAGGGHNESRDYEHYNWGALKKPVVTSPKRTAVIEVWERGVRVPTGKIELRITAGFNDQNEEFVFPNVPVE